MEGAGLGSLTEDVLRASRALVAIAARSIAEAGEDITLPQYRALVVLAGHGPLNVASLGEQLGMNAPSASEARRLIAQGGVHIGDTTIDSEEVALDDLRGRVMRVGKRRFVRLK